MKKTIFAKTFTALFLAASIFTLNTAMVFAHDEKSSDNGERTKDGSGTDQQQVATATASDFDFSFDSATSTATLLYADGTPLANAAVTVKNGETGETGDIEKDQAADANGVFDYSKWVDKGVKVLRITDPKTNSAIEYNVENGTMNIEAGRNKSGDGSGHSHGGVSSTTTYMAIAGVVVVIGIGAGVVVSKQKKKKAAFEAEQQAKANAKKKKKKKKDD